MKRLEPVIFLAFPELVFGIATIILLEHATVTSSWGSLLVGMVGVVVMILWALTWWISK